MSMPRIRSYRYIVIAFALATVLLGCTPVQPQEADAKYPMRVLSPDAVAYDGDRLLVKGTDGNIYTMDRDGRNAAAMTSDASDTVQYTQPSWSPEAERIAWTRLAGQGADIESSLVVADATGANRTTYDVPFPPFYISWNPDGSHLAYLSTWASEGRPSMALRHVDLESSSTAVRTLAEGQPFYFSWSPAGDELLAHVESEEIFILRLDGTRELLGTSAASFPAPRWFPSGERLLYAVDQSNRHSLVVTERDGSAITEVTKFDDSISFTLSPDERLIAYAVTSVAPGTSAFGPLYLVEIETGITRQLSELPVIAFFWSPDSEKLAFLAVDTEAGDFTLRWRVWDGTATTGYAAVLPTRTFLERYLAFFDQYAQSMTIWAPDSSAFAYAGIVRPDDTREDSDQRGRAGIWVQELDEETPRYVGPGVYAAWSPR